MSTGEQSEMPSWQPDPCPDWCTRPHREDDHPEDRFHQDDGAVFAAVVARVDPVTMERTAVPTEIVVRRSRAVVDGSYTWVSIVESENAGSGLSLSSESVPLLRGCLP